MYEDHEAYLESACTYIVSAIELNQIVLLVDTEKNWRLIQNLLAKRGVDLRHAYILFTSSSKFYEANRSFHCKVILQHFHETVSQLQTSGRQIRTWANVKWFSSKEVL